VEISIKLFGGLRRYLPPGSTFNGCRVKIDANTPLSALLKQLPVPAAKPYLVIVNDEKVSRQEYDHQIIGADDEIVLLPPIKGG